MGKIEEALKKASGTNAGNVEEQGSLEAPNEKGTQKDFARAKSYVLPPEETITRKPVDFRIVVYHNPESIAAEHFKSLRGQIMHPADGRKIKSVLVTSALDQEGKTTVACNLAISIAQSLDPYVLLIDSDVRRPNVHTMLGLEKGKGLTDFLLGDVSLPTCLQKGPLDKMRVLQAGSTVRNPAELLTSQKTKDLLSEVRERYRDRFVIIDSPPINLAAETEILANNVDAVIVVVRYGLTEKNALDEALSKISEEKLLGIVFNGYEITPRRYSYYKKHYSYY